MFRMATAKEWLDVEVNSIKALVGVIELGACDNLFTKKDLREVFNVPFAIIKRLGREQLIEDRRAYETGKTHVLPHRAEGVTGYRLLVDMAMQLPTDQGILLTDEQRKEMITNYGQGHKDSKAWSKKELHAHQLAMHILNTLELEPETLPNMVKRRPK